MDTKMLYNVRLLLVWNKRMTFIRKYELLPWINVAWCPGFCVLHGWYLIVSAENSLGVSWLEILAGESLQSSDNLHVPFQSSLFEILLQRQQEQKASDFPEV